MKSNIKKSLTVFLHQDCSECLETGRFSEGRKRELKRDGVYLTVIRDDSFQEIFAREGLPVLREEGMPPKYYYGKREISDYFSSLNKNYN